MDLEQIKNLPDDLKARYSKLERVFNSEGWALVVEWAKNRREESTARQLHAGNWDTALVNRGAAAAYAALETLQETSEQEFAAIAAANAERILLDDEADHE